MLTFLYDYRQAWKQLGDMEAEQAMQEYISCVNVLDPEGSTKVKRIFCQHSELALCTTPCCNLLNCTIFCHFE